MVFSDLIFLFIFIPLFLLTYFLALGVDRTLLTPRPLRRRRHYVCTLRNAVLILFSLIFYAWGEPVYVLLMVGSVLLNYLLGMLIGAYDVSLGKRKAALILGIVLNVSILGVFKYAGLIATTLASFRLPFHDPHIVLPIGISFYIFQSISYLVDVYRREAPPQRNFFGLLLYISMFPQLIAGPIVRYTTIATDIRRRHVTAVDVSEGIWRFLIGLGKKVLLANQLSAVSMQFLGGGFISGGHPDSQLTVAGAALGIVAFTLQIFYDFSGYSDMAIGLGRCLGFRFNENFRHPYCSSSITEFWRRWHISLGSFFRDYVYIPMGGNRRHQALNIFVVWMLTGLWHGASWNFALWGLFFGVIVFLEKFTILRLVSFAWKPFLHLYALVVVVIGWGIFYFEDFSDMRFFFATLFHLRGDLFDFTVESAFWDHFWIFVLAVLFSLPIYDSATKMADVTVQRFSPFLRTVLVLGVRIVMSLLILSFSVALLVGDTNNAFIYTRF